MFLNSSNPLLNPHDLRRRRRDASASSRRPPLFSCSQVVSALRPHGRCHGGLQVDDRRAEGRGGRALHSAGGGGVSREPAESRPSREEARRALLRALLRAQSLPRGGGWRSTGGGSWRSTGVRGEAAAGGWLLRALIRSVLAGDSMAILKQGRERIGIKWRERNIREREKTRNGGHVIDPWLLFLG